MIGEPGRRALVVLGLAVVVGGAIGAALFYGTAAVDHCGAVAQARERFASRRGEGDGPHALIALSHAALDTIVAPEVDAVRGRPIRLSAPPELEALFGAADARVTSVRSRPGGPDRLAFHIQAEVRVDRVRMLTFDVDASAVPEIDLEAGIVRVPVQADDLGEPEVDASGSTAVAERLHRRLPPLARQLVPRVLVERTVQRMVRQAVTELWPQTRRRIEEGLRMAQLELALPDLPLRDVRVSSEEGGVFVALTSTLPVVSTPLERPVPPEGSALAVELSGSAAAEVGNWGMTQGLVPQRVGLDGAPDPDGPFEVAMAWRDGEEPLEVQLFRLGPPCAHAVVRGTPELAPNGDTVSVTVDDARLASLTGDLSITGPALAAGAFERTFTATQEITGTARLSFGGRELDGRLRSVERRGDLFEAVIELGRR